MKKTLILCFLLAGSVLAYGEKSALKDAHTANVDGLAAGQYYKETHPAEPKDYREIKVGKPLGQDKGETVRVNINDEAAQMRREAAFGFDTASPTQVNAQGNVNAYIYNKKGRETMLIMGGQVPKVSEAVDATNEDDERYARQRKTHLKDYSVEEDKIQRAREEFLKKQQERKKLKRKEDDDGYHPPVHGGGSFYLPTDSQTQLAEPEPEKEEQAQEQAQQPAEQAQIKSNKRKGAWRTPKSTGPRPAEQPKEQPTLPHTTYEPIWVGTSDPEYLSRFIAEQLGPMAAIDYNNYIQASYTPEKEPELSGFFIPQNILRDAIGQYERDLRERKQREEQRRQSLHEDYLKWNHAGISNAYDFDVDKYGNTRYECSRSVQLSSDIACEKCCKVRATDFGPNAQPGGFNPEYFNMVKGQLGGEGDNKVCWCYWEAKRPSSCDPSVNTTSDQACTTCCDDLARGDASLYPKGFDPHQHEMRYGKVQHNNCLCSWETFAQKRERLAREEEERARRAREDEEVRRRNEEWNRQHELEMQWAREEREEEERQRRIQREREEREEEARRRQQEAEWEREEQERQRRIEQEQREYEERRERERLEQERIDEENRQRRAWEQEVDNARARMTPEELEEWIRRNIPW